MCIRELTFSSLFQFINNHQLFICVNSKIRQICYFTYRVHVLQPKHNIFMLFAKPLEEVFYQLKQSTTSIGTAVPYGSGDTIIGDLE